MDTLQTIINAIPSLLHNKAVLINIILLILGSILPSLIGIILPRRHTIKYGMLINAFVGTIFLQKRKWKSDAATNLWQALGMAVQTTFQDLSFGVYLSGRTDLTVKERNKKIKEYLAPRPEVSPAHPNP